MARIAGVRGIKDIRLTFNQIHVALLHTIDEVFILSINVLDSYREGIMRLMSARGGRPNRRRVHIRSRQRIARQIVLKIRRITRGQIFRVRRPRITRSARPRQLNQNRNVVAIRILVKAIDQVRPRNRQTIIANR